MAKYRRVSGDIRAIFEGATEVIEPVSLDEAYLDLTPEHLLGDVPAAQALALIARRVEREVGITVSIGLSANKFLAKLASEMEKPRGYSVIGQAEARGLLAAMPVAKINGVGSVTARRLDGCRHRDDRRSATDRRGGAGGAVRHDSDDGSRASPEARTSAR